MGARKIESYPIQILSLNAIKVDHSIQSRVETSKGYEREFAEAMLRGDTFPAITVYFDGRYYWLADGFHRYGAAKQASRMEPNLKGIKAEVRNGTRRDAVIFSAGANQQFSIPRTKEDIQKAVLMLLDDDEWRNKTPGAIAAHVGINRGTVVKYRAKYFADKNLQIPEETKGADGRRLPRRVKGRPLVSRAVNGTFRVSINGKSVSLGSNETAARERAAKLISEAKIQSLTQETRLLPSHFLEWLAARGLSFKSAAFPPGDEIGGAFLGYGAVLATANLKRSASRNSVDTVPESVGRVMISRQMIDPSARAVVVCYIEDAPPRLIEAGRALGVEFLTPDELVASLSGPIQPHSS